METARRVLVPLILVVALGLGIFAYMDWRNQRACDRWREDITVAFQNAFRGGIEPEESDFRNIRRVNSRRPADCPMPEIEPPE